MVVCKLFEEKIAVFVDTNAFQSLGFNFDERNIVLANFKELLQTQRYVHILISIVDNEIKKHIKDRTAENRRMMKKYCKWVYDIVDNSKIEEMLNKEFNGYEKFKSDTNTLNITIENINPENVMDKYFNIKPPFESAKLNEFKDAFFLEAIYNFVNEEDEDFLNFIVITADKGIKKAIDEYGNKKLNYYDNIPEFIDSVNSISAITKEQLFNYIKQYDFNDLIQNKINITVEDIEEYDEDIESCTCEGIYSPQIIKKIGNKITVVCDMFICLNGSFRCLDYDKSYYSNEERDYIYKVYKERKFLGFICQSVLDIEAVEGNFGSIDVVDIPEIEISYESFLNIEDYAEREL